MKERGRGFRALKERIDRGLGLRHLEAPLRSRVNIKFSDEYERPSQNIPNYRFAQDVVERDIVSDTEAAEQTPLQE